mmetsp:Transcript_31862/g.75069  ORF Transcript_31862/g.75069 Transcript_31862/m.75069 type:complete len:286 (-) Transcript_31862:850-1707(-)
MLDPLSHPGSSPAFMSSCTFYSLSANLPHFRGSHSVSLAQSPPPSKKSDVQSLHATISSSPPPRGGVDGADDSCEGQLSSSGLASSAMSAPHVPQSRALIGPQASRDSRTSDRPSSTFRASSSSPVVFDGSSSSCGFLGSGSSSSSLMLTAARSSASSSSSLRSCWLLSIAAITRPSIRSSSGLSNTASSITSCSSPSLPSSLFTITSASSSSPSAAAGLVPRGDTPPTGALHSCCAAIFAAPPTPPATTARAPLVGFADGLEPRETRACAAVVRRVAAVARRHL